MSPERAKQLLMAGHGGIALQADPGRTLEAYCRIADLPANVSDLTTPELRALSKAWLERKSELSQGGEYQEFLKRLQREWAIETGIIERLFNWERGVTEVLIEQGIDAALIASRGGLHRDRAEHVKCLIDDHLSIMDALFSFVEDEQPLTEHFIRSMHGKFTTHQENTEGLTPDGKRTHVPLLRGEYKKRPNNPRRPSGEVHAYCPPEIVSEEMERLVAWYHQAPAETPPELLSAWLHHRFTCIHPFQDGNGRVARALASLVFLKAGLFPLVIRDSDRSEYIDALERADSGDIRPLVALFAKRQRDSVLKAIGLEQQVQQAGHAEQIISSTVQLLRDKFAAKTEQLQEVYTVADQLLGKAQDRMSQIRDALHNDLVTVRSSYASTFESAASGAQNSYYYYHQIVETAQQCKYFANLDRYKAWGRLQIRTEGTFELLVSLHGYGHQENGIMVASASTARRIPREGGGTEPADIRPAMTDLFQFNYAEALESTERRFEEWLESAITIGLAEWRRTLNP